MHLPILFSLMYELLAKELTLRELTLALCDTVITTDLHQSELLTGNKLHTGGYEHHDPTAQSCLIQLQSKT